VKAQADPQAQAGAQDEVHRRVHERARAQRAARRGASTRRYVRASPGRHARWRRAGVWFTQLVFFGLPWLGWNGRPLLRFDVAAQTGYLAGLQLMPRDVVYLCGLLLLALGAQMLALVLVARSWCGYACPHTVYADIYLAIERLVEGSAGARTLRERAPRTALTWARKACKHALWAAVALACGCTLASYFAAPGALLAGPAPWQWLVMATYAALTYVGAGWLRETICRSMCPLAALLGALAGRATRVVSYDAARGEPRAPRRRTAVLAGGACVDCSLCVQVCPSGSDIRRGFQPDCLGCGACIDACDAVMDKLGQARGLIAYSALTPGTGASPLALILALLLLAGVLGAGLAQRVPLALDVARDRPIPGEDSDGNIYRLHIVNADRRAHDYRIAVAGGAAPLRAWPACVRVAAGADSVLAVRVTMAPGAVAGSGAPVARPIAISLRARDDAAIAATEAAVFIAAPAS
jgi:cytochrome c oxidase accessory protein FixG